VTDPFLIDGPTCISFSGGRTSAYMLWRVLQSNGGLPEQAKVCFANTGKEEEATLRFVDRCSKEWGVPITWVEYQNAEETRDRFRVVTYETASRDGEPFEALIRKRNYLPNPVSRFCTVELKINPELQFLKSNGWTEWDDFIGIRFDEARRVAKIKANPSGGKAGPERRMPLADARLTKETVGEFWRNQSFDLELPNINGVTMHGNCDLCYLKGASQILSLIKEKPERAVWWARMESIGLSSTPDGGKFRADRPSYAQMSKFASQQMDMFGADDHGIDCFCGD
jgi:3'-phosphoadenosine 5'-phosphosulfate sulfotransferase (PAPS reductase)/FAD synthetase